MDNKGKDHQAIFISRNKDIWWQNTLQRYYSISRRDGIIFRENIDMEEKTMKKSDIDIFIER